MRQFFSFQNDLSQADYEQSITQFYQLIGEDGAGQHCATQFLQKFPTLSVLHNSKSIDVDDIKQLHDAHHALLMAMRIGGQVHYLPPRLLKANKSEEVGQYLIAKMRHIKQEQLWLLLLDAQLQVISVEVIFVGTLTQVKVSTREIFQAALAKNAYAMIIAHNHPSGVVTPSHADLSFTKSVQNSGELLDLPLIDSFVVGEHQYWSMLANHQLDTTRIGQKVTLQYENN